MKAFVEKNKHITSTIWPKKGFFFNVIHLHLKAFVEKNKHNRCLAKASAKKFMCL